MPSKVKDKVGKYAHRYGRETAIAHFRGKYQQYSLKRTPVSNWQFSSPQKEVDRGRRTTRKIQQKRYTFIGWRRVAGKNKGSDYRNKTNTSCDFSEDGSFNW